MREKLTLDGLDKFLKKSKFSRVIFDSANQNDEHESCSLKFDIQFNEIRFIPGTRTLMIKGQASAIYFENIKYLYSDDEKTRLGTVIYVTCIGAALNDEVTYTLIAS